MKVRTSLRAHRELLATIQETTERLAELNMKPYLNGIEVEEESQLRQTLAQANQSLSVCLRVAEARPRRKVLRPGGVLYDTGVVAGYVLLVMAMCTLVTLIGFALMAAIYQMVKLAYLPGGPFLP